MLHLIFLLIGILNIYSSVHVSSQTMPVDGTQCNSCCQGRSGHNGHNGLPGRDGIKGEKGEIGGLGLNGERGLPGPQGPSGEKGGVGLQGVQGLRGQPGNTGPEGLKGTAGVDGQRGPVGEKGDKGDIGLKGASGERNGRSAFTAIKTSHQTGDSGDVLTFDITETNIGNNFDVSTSRFTCQIPGVYWFTFTLFVIDDGDTYCDLVKDGTKITRARFYEGVSGGIFAQSTNGAVLQLAAGDQVWIQFASTGKQVYSTSERYTTFSGFLLYED